MRLLSDFLFLRNTGRAVKQKLGQQKSEIQTALRAGRHRLRFRLRSATARQAALSQDPPSRKLAAPDLPLRCTVGLRRHFLPLGFQPTPRNAPQPNAFVADSFVFTIPAHGGGSSAGCLTLGQCSHIPGPCWLPAWRGDLTCRHVHPILRTPLPWNAKPRICAYAGLAKTPRTNAWHARLRSCGNFSRYAA